jgi:hypothetical protein
MEFLNPFEQQVKMMVSLHETMCQDDYTNRMYMEHEKIGIPFWKAQFMELQTSYLDACDIIHEADEYPIDHDDFRYVVRSIALKAAVTLAEIRGVSLKKIADDMIAIHRKKNHDYSPKGMFGNFKVSHLIGIPAWKGCFIRLQDKYTRACNLIRRDGDRLVTNESLEDTLLDLANYALICLTLFFEVEAIEKAKAEIPKLEVPAMWKFDDECKCGAPCEDKTPCDAKTPWDDLGDALEQAVQEWNETNPKKPLTLSGEEEKPHDGIGYRSGKPEIYRPIYPTVCKCKEPCPATDTY